VNAGQALLIFLGIPLAFAAIVYVIAFSRTWIHGDQGSELPGIENASGPIFITSIGSAPDPTRLPSELSSGVNGVVAGGGASGTFTGEVAEATAKQRKALRETIELAREISGRCFGLYVGPLADGNVSARAKHAQISGAATAVLLAVDTDRGVIEIVTGIDAITIIDDRTCELAALATRSGLEGGDLVGGLRDGLMLLAEHARAPRVWHLDDVA